MSDNKNKVKYKIPKSGTFKPRLRPEPISARKYDTKTRTETDYAPRRVRPTPPVSVIPRAAAPDFGTLRLPRVDRLLVCSPGDKHAGPIPDLSLRWGDDVLRCTRVFFQNYGRFYFFASRTEFGDDVPLAPARTSLANGLSPVLAADFNTKNVDERNEVSRYALFYYHMRRRAELWKDPATPLVGTASEPLCVGFDCEWTENGDTRDVVSRQYAFRVAGGAFAGIAVLEPNLPQGRRGLLGQDLGCIISELVRFNVPMYLPVAHGHFDPIVNITLAAHTASVDLSCLDDSKALFRTCVPLSGGGLLGRDVYRTEYTPCAWTGSERGLHVVRKKGGSPQTTKRRNVCHVTVRDTLGLAPEKKRRLKDLGNLCGTPKLELPAGIIERMDRLIDENTQLYLDYAMTDAFIVVDYLARMFGHNVRYPGTLGTVVSQRGRLALFEHYGVSNPRELDLRYTGLTRVEADGKVRMFVPLNFAAGTAQSLAVECYMGGRNESFTIGPRTEGPYCDVDLKNAYPSALATIRDIPWDDPRGCCITVTNRTMTDALCGNHEMGFGIIDFEFPESCKYPCLPIRASGGLVFPLTGTDVYASLPEVRVALRAGARVFAKSFVFLKQRGGHPFRRLMKDLTAKRAEYTETDGKDSLGACMFKELSCMVYGKAAQGIRNVFRFDPGNFGTCRVPFSPLTNPVVAAHTTALVRAAVSALIIQLHEKGYDTESVTTDGLITNAPPAVIASCDLFGLRDRFERAWKSIVPDPYDTGVWAVKHLMDWFVNIKTRGNIAPNRCGVLARAGVKLTPDEKRKLEEDPEGCRSSLIERYLGRDGPIVCSWRSLPSLRDYFEKNADGTPRTVSRGLSWEYDLKRRPDGVVDRIVTFRGTEYRHAVSTTMPWRTVGEFDTARRAHLRMSRALSSDGRPALRVLGTAGDFEDLACEMEKGGKADCSQLEHRLRCFLTAYRAGFVDVPEFAGLSGRAVCALVRERTGIAFSDVLWARFKSRGRGVSALALVKPLMGLLSFPFEFRVDVASDATLSALRDGSPTPHSSNCGDPDTFLERVREYVATVPADLFLSEESLTYDAVLGRRRGANLKGSRACPGKPYSSKVPRAVRDAMAGILESRGWDMRWSFAMTDEEAFAAEMADEAAACAAFVRDFMPDETGLSAADVAALRRGARNKKRRNDRPREAA